MSQLQEYQTISYPPKKETWGPAYWVYLHTTATQYPEVPNRSDRLSMSEHIRQWLNFIPCEDPCQIHAKEFVKKNPPALDSKESLLEWTCALHNSVNEKLGKPISRCLLAGKEIECSDCKVAASAAGAADIQGSMKMYKSATVQIIQELSKRHDLKAPEVRFAACPLHPDTSCIEWKKEHLNDKGILEGPAIIYINPYAASFKTPIHEFQHYLDLKKGRGHHLSEYEANRFAYEVLAKMFPHDTAAAKGGDASAAASESERIDPFKMPLGYEYGNFKNWEDRFPTFKAIRDRARKQENPEQQPTPAGDSQQPPDSQEEKTGIMSHIDSMYQLPAEWSGLRAHDLNMAWTPEIISNAVNLLVRSNLSGLGSALFGFVASLSLMLTGIFAKQGLAYGDRQLLQNLSASFLMNTLTYANPKFSGDIVMDGKYLMGSVGAGQMGFGTIKNALWETPEIYMMKQQKLHAATEGGMEVGGVPFSFGPGFAGAGESVRSQQQASQRSYDASRPGGAVSLSQGPFGRAQRVIGRNPRRMVMTPPGQVQPPGQAMFVSGEYQNFSGFGGSSPGVPPARRSPAADDTDIDVTMSPDTYGNDNIDY